MATTYSFSRLWVSFAFWLYTLQNDCIICIWAWILNCLVSGLICNYLVISGRPVFLLCAMEYGGVGRLLAAWQVSYHTDVSLSWQWTDVPSSVCCVMLVFSKSETDDLSGEAVLTDLTHSPLCYLIISLNYSLCPPLFLTLHILFIDVSALISHSLLL